MHYAVQGCVLKSYSYKKKIPMTAFQTTVMSTELRSEKFFSVSMGVYVAFQVTVHYEWAYLSN